MKYVNLHEYHCALFSKFVGEHFDIPEVVPFRLTANMVHAMGPLGIEGQYRKCCEITMRVLQEQTQTLLSVLRPLIYDPALAWTRQVTKSDVHTERIDESAKKNIQNIEERLKGHVS